LNNSSHYSDFPGKNTMRYWTHWKWVFLNHCHVAWPTLWGRSLSCHVLLLQQVSYGMPHLWQHLGRSRGKIISIPIVKILVRCKSWTRQVNLAPSPSARDTIKSGKDSRCPSSCSNNGVIWCVVQFTSPWDQAYLVLLFQGWWCQHLDRLVFLPQEHLHFVMEISHDEIFILDPDMVVSQQAGTPPGMPDLVVEQASGWVCFSSVGATLAV